MLIIYLLLPPHSLYNQGGRKFRTGKWRPLGLFQKGRRTCMLSHARVGKSDIRHETILLPYEIANNIKADESSFQDLIKTMESLYFECKMATYGLPRFMEAVDELG